LDQSQSDGLFPSLSSLPSATFDALPARGPRPAAEPPRNAGRRAGGFRGDTAVAELRTMLALQPHQFDDPPVQPGSASSPARMWAGRIAGVAVVVAIGFLGYRWGASPHAPVSVQALLQQAAAVETGLRQDPSGSVVTGPVAVGPAIATPAVATQTVPTQPVPAQPVVNALPVVYSPPGRTAALPPAAARTLRPQLTVGTTPALQADAVVRLPISAFDAGPRSAVVISGLVPGATLSAGQPVTPTVWQVAVGDLPVDVAPPAGFAGTMDVNVELRGGDGSVAERRWLRLEWLAKTPQKPAAQAKPRVQHQPGEIAQIIRRGEELMSTGDAAAARLMYQRAAEAGDATAAFRLAETYDPTLRSSGLAPDLDRAHTWYARAKDLGSAQASERLERLAHQ
jgi:hypothetical protein